MTRDETKPTDPCRTQPEQMSVPKEDAHGLRGRSPGFMSFSSSTDSHLAPVPRMVIL